MNSNDNMWVINPADLFQKLDDENQNEPSFSQYENLNLTDLDAFLDNATKNMAIATNEPNKDSFNNILSIDDQEQQSPIENSIGSSGMGNSVNWDEILSDEFRSDLGSIHLDNIKNEVGMEQEPNTFHNINTMDHEILKHQNELNNELQRQKEVNMKLEQQLKQTRLQQQQLRNRLKEQEELSVPRLVLGNITQSSRLNSTPKKKLKEFNISKSTNTSPTKKHHNTTKLSFVTPMYSSSNISPKRKHYRSKSVIPEDEVCNLKPQTSKENKLKINFATTLTPRNQNDYITDSALSSPIHAASNGLLLDSPVHGSIDRSSPVIGLGINSNLDMKRNSISVLPMTTNPLNRSPISNKNESLLDGLPTTFQDTPVKQNKFVSPNDILMPPTDEDIANEYCIKGIDIQSNAPKLNPPSNDVLTSPRSSKVEGAECEFSVSKTPSPTLKSQGNFEGHSPQFGYRAKEIEKFIPTSPLKITRKLTTLPRGSIDRYVKELPDKTFECLYPDCSKFFKRRYNIRSHIQTHLEDRPYSCDYPGCSKAFVRNHDLVRHKKSHLEKRYACPCGKLFNREDALIVHRSRMICSGGKKYDHIVIKRSPRKRGRPRKDATIITAVPPSSSNQPHSLQHHTGGESNKENYYGSSLVFKMTNGNGPMTNFGISKDLNSL
ncbi:transcriptional factor Swi5p [Monosporozyma servazzii]